jgi:alkylhydroperoxidase family enzyme
MPRVAVPADKDPMMHVWGALAPALTQPAAAFSSAVYASSKLGLREFEAARIRIALVNDCNVCLNWRSARDVPGKADDPDAVPEAFYADVLDARYENLTARERLSADFATKFAADHLAIDDDMWAQLHEHFSDDEIVDLSLCVGAWIAFGRLNRVLDIDGACRVGAPMPG